jgi:hypothetical protein
MHRAEQVLALALPFVWLGLVLGISVIETPLKFRAPGITIPLGLGIGRLVFRALNAVEIVLACALGIVLVAVTSGWPLALLVALLAVLLFQTFWLRPALDRRALRVIGGEDLPHSSLHVVYIGLESVKIVAIPFLACALALRFLP